MRWFFGVFLVACASSSPAGSGETGGTGGTGDQATDDSDTGSDSESDGGTTTMEGSSDGSSGESSTGTTGSPAVWCGREELLVSEAPPFGGDAVLRLDGQLYLYDFQGSADGFTISRYRVEDGLPVLEVEVPTNGSGRIGDFNGDGLPDVWTSPNILVEGSEIRFGVAGPAVFTDPTPVDYGGKILPRRVALADFNGDGALDLMSHASSWSTVYVALSNGTGEYLPDYEGAGPSTLYEGGGTSIARNDPTRIAVNYGHIVMHRLVGDAIITEATGPADYRGVLLDVHDDDGDDLTEAYVVAEGQVAHVEATPEGTLTITELFPTHDHTFARDFDGDGDTDLLRWSDGSIALFHERYSGGFEDGVEVELSPLPPEPRVSLVDDYDFDGDGDLVYAVTDPGGTQVYAVSVEACE